MSHLYSLHIRTQIQTHMKCVIYPWEPPVHLYTLSQKFPILHTLLNAIIIIIIIVTIVIIVIVNETANIYKIYFIYEKKMHLYTQYNKKINNIWINKFLTYAQKIILFHLMNLFIFLL